MGPSDSGEVSRCTPPCSSLFTLTPSPPPAPPPRRRRRYRLAPPLSPGHPHTSQNHSRPETDPTPREEHVAPRSRTAPSPRRRRRWSSRAGTLGAPSTFRPISLDCLFLLPPSSWNLPGFQWGVIWLSVPVAPGGRRRGRRRVLELRRYGGVPVLRVLRERAARRPRRRLLPNLWPVSSSAQVTFAVFGISVFIVCGLTRTCGNCNSRILVTGISLLALHIVPCIFVCLGTLCSGNY